MKGGKRKVIRVRGYVKNMTSTGTRYGDGITQGRCRHCRVEDKLVAAIERRAKANKRSFVREVNVILELDLENLPFKD